MGRPDVGERVWFFLSGLLVVAPSIYLYHSIFGIDIQEMYWLYAIVSIFSAVVLSISHANVAYWLRLRLQSNREDTITANMVASANEGKKDQNKTKKEKDSQRGHTKSESSNFAILYNNFFFLFAFFVLGS